MTKEQKFYKALQDVFIGAKIEGKGGFVNLMRIKSNYYRKIEEILKNDIESALSSYPKFRDELFDKLYSFFSRYFTESGSIYFNSTPFHNNIYEKVYTDEKDVILFWKTQMLYYVKTDRIFRSLPVEFPSERGVSEGRDINSPLIKGCPEGTGYLKFYFDASKIESKKANEKRSLVFELDKIHDDGTIVFGVQYSERGRKTKQDEILKTIKRKGIAITEEQLERAFRVFEKQSEVDFFINKNAKAFLQEQFKLWSYQYFWEGAKEWGADRVNQLQILKDIAFKIIDFISQFEDELVKIWNKPKFVKNSNYVITLDRITDKKLVEKIKKHKNFSEQVKEWKELGIVDEKFRTEDVFEDSPSTKGWQSEGLTGYLQLPYNPRLKEKARDLRKAGNLSEVLLWNELKNKKLGFDFTRQQIIGNYIVDFHCPRLNLVIEIDGESHHNFKGEYDEKRDDYLKSLGLTVLHFKDIDVKKDLNSVVEQISEWIKNSPFFKRSTREAGEVFNTLSASQTPLLIKGEFRHLPIDTKYFKDLELEILSQFEDLDKSLDGWLIKSENYQALNTILPKFKEQVQTIYIDPPFNTGEDFFYKDKFQDSTWLTLLVNRLNFVRTILKPSGNFYIHLDRNANYYGRILSEEALGRANFKAEISWDTCGITGFKSSPNNWIKNSDSILHYCKELNKSLFIKPYTLINAKDPKKADEERKEKKLGWLDILEKDGKFYIEVWEDGKFINKYVETKNKFDPVGMIWTDILSFLYTQVGNNESFFFKTQKPEHLLRRIIQSSCTTRDIVMDFFAGIGTTMASAHKLNRRWVGIEMGNNFDTFYLDKGEKKIGILGRMKIVLSGDKTFSVFGHPRHPQLSRNLNWQGGGFFKYYELEQYEEALANCKYEESDLFNSPSKTPYQEYVFMKDEKMLKAVEIDYEKEKVKVDLDKLYPNIDIAETLSNLTGKWVKKVNDAEVEFEDGTKINTKDLDYKLIKPLIWWE